MTLATPSRRGFIRGIGALLAAPAIVRASSLMPVRALDLEAMLRPLGFGYAREWVTHVTERVIFYGDPSAVPVVYSGFVLFATAPARG